MEIDITGKPKAAILAALYNASRVQGMRFMQDNPGPMTEAMAEQELEASQGKYFDYLHGKVMKVNLSKDYIDPWLYDRDNGEGAAHRAIKHLLG